MALLPVPLISILSMMFAYLACLNPSFLIFAAMCLSVFLYLDVITFCKRFGYSSLQRDTYLTICRQQLKFCLMII